MSRVDESLFEETKMSFGEHLEELRVALFKALIGLIIGVLLGLGVANRVVEQIKSPLEAALKGYYQEKAEEEVALKYGAISEDLKKFITDNQVVYDEVFVERSELARQTNFASGKSVDELAAPTKDMIKTRVWRPISATVKSLSAHEVFMIWMKAAVITTPVARYTVFSFRRRPRSPKGLL